jgi:hypothetical protein
VHDWLTREPVAPIEVNRPRIRSALPGSRAELEQALVPGLYKWGTGVSISTGVTLDGGPNDVWIFQIAGDLTQASDVIVTLSGGASPQNIFWQAFGQVMIGTNAHFEGVVLCETAIVLETGASVNGRLLAQTAVTLDQNAVTQPTPPSL